MALRATISDEGPAPRTCFQSSGPAGAVLQRHGPCRNSIPEWVNLTHLEDLSWWSGEFRLYFATYAWPIARAFRGYGNAPACASPAMRGRIARAMTLNRAPILVNAEGTTTKPRLSGRRPEVCRSATPDRNGGLSHYRNSFNEAPFNGKMLTADRPRGLICAVRPGMRFMPPGSPFPVDGKEFLLTCSRSSVMYYVYRVCFTS